jgi:RHS repeat-associated protein
MSASGSFQYDPDGNLVRDASKGMDIQYDWSGMPVRFSTATSAEYMYYDADGRLASRVDASIAGGTEKRVRGTHYVLLEGEEFKEWRETYANGGPALSDSMEICALSGRSGPIGRSWSADGGKTRNDEFFIKNNQGSIMRVVKPDGTYAQQMAADYLAYGNPSPLRQAPPPVTEGYTGKEYLDFARLQYYGARYFDPELGLWLSPDAAREYPSPYARGGDPVNLVDADGNCEIVCAAVIITAALIGAYYGGSKANHTYDPTKWNWDDKSTYLGIGIGGVVGGLSGYATAGYAAGMGLGELMAIGSATSVASELSYDAMDGKIDASLTDIAVSAMTGAITSVIPVNGSGWAVAGGLLERSAVNGLGDAVKDAFNHGFDAQRFGKNFLLSTTLDFGVSYMVRSGLEGMPRMPGVPSYPFDNPDFAKDITFTQSVGTFIDKLSKKAIKDKIKNGSYDSPIVITKRAGELRSSGEPMEMAPGDAPVQSAYDMAEKRRIGASFVLMAY